MYTDPDIETNKEKDYCIIVGIFHGISEENIGCISSVTEKGNNMSDEKIIQMLMKYFKELFNSVNLCVYGQENRWKSIVALQRDNHKYQSKFI